MTENLTREEALKKLLDNECSTVEQMVLQNDLSYVNDIFTSGFKGYINFTNKELASELYEQIGLSNGTKYKVTGR